MIIPGGQIGEIASKGRVAEKQYQAVNTDDLSYCWRHNLTLTSDWKNPSKEDQKQLDKIRLIPQQITEKDGTVHKFRFCKKCWSMVEYTKIPC